ncbi:MAG: APC family permease [Anaerolineae bacterium]
MPNDRLDPDPMPPAPTASTTLARRLGLAAAVAIVVGEVIGVGIFLTPAEMTQTLGAPLWLLVVWLVMGTMALCGALSFGELAARWPDAGGQYVYLRETFGLRWAFLYGWMALLVMDPGITASLAVGFATYVGYAVPLSPLAGKGAAMAIIALLAALNVLGVRQSATFVRWLTVLKVAFLAFIALVAFGRGLGDWGHFTPFAQRPAGAGSLFGAMAGGLVGAFFAYGGWWGPRQAQRRGEGRRAEHPAGDDPGRRDRDGRLHRDERRVHLPRPDRRGDLQGGVRRARRRTALRGVGRSAVRRHRHRLRPGQLGGPADGRAARLLRHGPRRRVPAGRRGDPPALRHAGAGDPHPGRPGLRARRPRDVRPDPGLLHLRRRRLPGPHRRRRDRHAPPRRTAGVVPRARLPGAADHIHRPRGRDARPPGRPRSDAGADGVAVVALGLPVYEIVRRRGSSGRSRRRPRRAIDGTGGDANDQRSDHGKQTTQRGRGRRARRRRGIRRPRRRGVRRRRGGFDRRRRDRRGRRRRCRGRRRRPRRRGDQSPSTSAAASRSGRRGTGRTGPGRRTRRR